MKPAIWLFAAASSLLTGCITAGDVDRQFTTKNTEFMLSFDDGPLPQTERVLDILATLRAVDGKPVKAGFFLLADPTDEFWQRRIFYAPYELWTDKGSIAKYPKIARRIKQAGHVIGNHTAHHAWFQWPWLDKPETVLNEITQWETTSTLILGAAKIRLFRPPYLILNANVRETAEHLGYQIVMGESVGDAIPGITIDAIKQKTQSLLAAWNKPYPCVRLRPCEYKHPAYQFRHFPSR
ncbi:MAG: polysaccharide deacetylase family protein [Methylococcales bacterium]